MNIVLRQISEEDSPFISSLSIQLGYALSAQQASENIRAILANADHTAFVAVHGNKVIGWIGVSQALLLESEPCCEVRGLVVDEGFRRQGIGKMLVDRAKLWCREKGHKKLRLRCNVKRKDAHRFYQQLNFAELKEQKVFEIRV